MELKQIKKLIKETGLPISTSTGSRISGWSNHTSEGVNIGNIYPWKKMYVRNGLRIPSILSDKQQKISISYIPNISISSKIDKNFLKREKEAIKKLATIFGSSIEKDSYGLKIKVMVDNPFSDREIELANSKFINAVKRK